MNKDYCPQKLKNVIREVPNFLINPKINIFPLIKELLFQGNNEKI